MQTSCAFVVDAVRLVSNSVVPLTATLSPEGGEGKGEGRGR